MIAEDQIVMRIGLRAALQKIPGVQIVGEVGDGQTAIDMAKELHPAVIFMDVSMPQLDGIEATRAIKDSQPSIRIIMFTSKDDEKAFSDSLSAGADGYCLKSATEQQLAGAINAVMQGATWLDSGVASKVLRQKKAPAEHDTIVRPLLKFSKEQRQILRLIVRGLDFNEIAKDLQKSTANLKLELNIILSLLRGGQNEPDSASATYRRLKDVLDSAKQTCPDHLPTIEIGQVLGGKYVVEAVIGEGGMSIVYQAKHTLLNKTVAIKMLQVHLLTDTVQVKRLENEARAASSINHPNIIAVHDFGVTDDGQPYFVMDFVRGENLAEMLHREKKLPIKVCLSILIQVCDALSALHAAGIIHRDLKSSNIMLVQEKGVLSAKLVDFGIAKSVSGAASGQNLTIAGEIFGSPAYMSPEQCLGRPVDVRSDLYSLGCILYQVLTGKIPFDGDEPLNIMWQQVHEVPSTLPFLDNDSQVPIQLRTALFELLNKDPDKRFQSADRLKFEFETILHTIELHAQTTK